MTLPLVKTAGGHMAWRIFIYVRGDAYTSIACLLSPPPPPCMWRITRVVTLTYLSGGRTAVAALCLLPACRAPLACACLYRRISTYNAMPATGWRCRFALYQPGGEGREGDGMPRDYLWILISYLDISYII